MAQKHQGNTTQKHADDSNKITFGQSHQPMKKNGDIKDKEDNKKEAWKSDSSKTEKSKEENTYSKEKKSK